MSIAIYTLTSELHDEQAVDAVTREFLNSLGIELIEWPYNWQKPEAEKNFAVLDDRNVKIVRIEKVELDPKGHQLIEGSQHIIKEF